MNPFIYSLFIVTALCTAAIPVKSTYMLSKDYAVTINGTSNLHNWDEKVEQVSGNCIVDITTKESFDLESLSIIMDVHSIKSDMGLIMNDNTYKALKADQYPKIAFTLSSPIKAIDLLTGSKNISAKGILTIAGISKPIEMQVVLGMPTEGKMTFEGSQIIKMTDYNIEPPTALMGTLKTGNEITIHFKTNFELSSH